MLKNLFSKKSDYSAQEELEKLHALSNNALMVFDNMVQDLTKVNENLENLASKADFVADEHTAMAMSARGKIKNNADIIEKISKIMA